MISLRSHVVSLAAVFIALALGLVLGSTTLSDGLLGGLRDDNSTLASRLDATSTARPIAMPRETARPCTEKVMLLPRWLLHAF